MNKEIILTTYQITSFRSLHKTLRDKRQADKIKTILLLNQGFSHLEVAEILLLDEKTIRNNRDLFLELLKSKGNDFKIEDFLEDNYIGYQGKLTKEEIEKVKKFVENNIIMDSMLVIVFIKENFNKDYTRQGINNLLHSEGFVYKKTKKVPSKANKEKQEEFMKLYKELSKNLDKEKEIIYFIDGVHPLHNVQNEYGWIRKGTEKEIKANTGRDRVNINGAYNLENQEAVIVEGESVNAQTTIELYEKLEEKNKNKETVYVIRDGAKYYNNNLVKEYLKTSKIKEIVLPPYSPNLNVIERLWLFFKKRITYNKYYEKFSDFKKVVIDFFEKDILILKNELKTFITENSMKPIGF